MASSQEGLVEEVKLVGPSPPRSHPATPGQSPPKSALGTPPGGPPGPPGPPAQPRGQGHDAFQELETRFMSICQ